MTDQEAYEQMREYFSRPGAVRAMDDEGTCLYRTEDGNKCAFGCLIPDELYDPAFENESVDCLLDSGECYVSRHDNPEEKIYVADLIEFFSEVDPRFIQKAQTLHDDKARDAAHFVELLDDLAVYEYGLTVPSP